MVLTRNAVFRFRAEIDRFLQKMRQAGQAVQQVGTSSVAASGGVRQMETSMRSAADASAAAQVRFQTMTQGMLNLSTASIQTFTSFSNLDRAANRAAQAQIAVARAQDLLANKQERLDQIQKAGLGTTQKAINITKELTTAKADLIVKIDKEKIESKAILDIQLLFGANIANVLISSIQTLTTLKQVNALATIKQVIATKLLVRVQAQQVAVGVGAMGALTSGTVATRGMTFAIRGMTFSVRSLLLVLGPIGLAITGIAIAMQAWEENWGGFRDTLQETFPFMRDLKGLSNEVALELEGAAGATDSFNASLGEHQKVLFKLPETYAGIAKRLKELTADIVVSQKLIEGNIPQGFSQAPGKGFPKGTQLGFLSGIQLFGVRELGQRAAFFASPEFILGPESGGGKAGAVFGGTNAIIRQIGGGKLEKGIQFNRFGRPLGTTGLKVQEAALKQQRDKVIGLIQSFVKDRQLAEDILISGDFRFLPEATKRELIGFQLNEQIVLASITAGGLGVREFEQQTILSSLKTKFPEAFAIQRTQELAKIEAKDITARQIIALQFEATRQGLTLEEFTRRRGISGFVQARQIPGLTPTRAEIDALKNTVLRIGLGAPRLPQKVKAALSIRRSLEAGKFLPTDTSFDRLIAQTFGTSKIFEQDKLARILGEKFNIGAIANVIPEAEAERIRQLERGLGFFANTRGGQAAGLLEFIKQQAGGVESATAAFQVPRGSIKVDPIIAIIRAIEDNNRNKLRTGGVRVLDQQGILLPLSDPEAVEGGFTSISLFRRDARERAFFRGRRAITIASLLGARFGGKFRIRSALARRFVAPLFKFGLERFLSRSVFKVTRGGGSVNFTAPNITFNQQLLAQAQQFIGFIPTIPIAEGGFGTLAAFQERFEALRERRERFQDLLSLSFQQQANIELNVQRGITELEDRVRFAERLEAMTVGVSSI